MIPTQDVELLSTLSTLFQKGCIGGSGGNYGLNNHKQHHYLNRVRAKTNKILDFVLIYFWMFSGGSFFEFFWNGCKQNFFYSFDIITPMEKSLKFSNLELFLNERKIFCHHPSKVSMIPAIVNWELFLVSIDIQRSNKYDGSHFWA